MFPFRTSSIFRSRWIALLWAAGICWTAIDLAGSGDDDSGNNQASADQNVAQPDIAGIQAKLRNW